MALKHDDSSSSYIPDDLITDILARLPVKSLVRFKSVCRTWSNIIMDPSFVSMHLANSRTGKRIRSDTCAGVSVNSLGHLRDGVCVPDNLYGFLKLHVGIEGIRYSIKGYCNGIFCLSWRHLERDHYNHDSWSPHTGIALFNPALRELHVLPMSESDFPPYRMREDVDIGFGYDPKTNDYKVVKIVTFQGSEGLDMLEVYSMKSNTWRKVVTRGSDKYAAVQKIRAMVFLRAVYTVDNGLGGVLHWSMWTTTMDRDLEFAIVSFLMDDDSLRVTRVPSNYTSDRPIPTVFHNEPAAICFSDTYVEVLQMKKYEADDDSWSVAATLEGLPRRSKPLGFWNDNVLLMFGYCGSNTLDGSAFLFDIATKQLMDLEEVSREMDFFYTETLVSVKP